MSRRAKIGLIGGAVAILVIGSCCCWMTAMLGAGGSAVTRGGGASGTAPTPPPVAAGGDGLEELRPPPGTDTPPMVSPATAERDLCERAGAEPLPALETAATLRLSVEVGADSRARVVGRTNLPAGAVLMIDVRRESIPGIDGLMGQTRATVAGSCFVTEPIGPASGLAVGSYRASAITPVVQPAEVAAVLGRDLERLRGPNVERDGSARALRGEVAFPVGSEDDAAEADRDLTATRRALRNALGETVRAGRAMEPIRSRDRRGDLDAARECGARMRVLQALARGPCARAEAVGARLLAGVCPDVEVCASCASDAMDACRRADSALRDADRETEGGRR